MPALIRQTSIFFLADVDRPIAAGNVFEKGTIRFQRKSSAGVALSYCLFKMKETVQIHWNQRKRAGGKGKRRQETKTQRGETARKRKLLQTDRPLLSLCIYSVMMVYTMKCVQRSAAWPAVPLISTHSHLSTQTHTVPYNGRSRQFLCVCVHV